MEQATVIRSTGSWYTLRTEAGAEYQARMLGKFRLNGLHLTNPVAVGDSVKFEVEDSEERSAIIKEILPRKNYIIRQSPRKRHQLHLLASNIDQALLVATIIQPNLKPGVIDRFLLMTEPHDIPVGIVFNKKDIYDEQHLNMYAYLQEVYQDIGYKVFLVSSLDQDDLAPVKDFLKEKTTLVSGQSGVGKSTLINSIHPALNIRTTSLSDHSGKGQHTTTFAEMHRYRDSFIIDTPGFKTLSFNNLEPMDVAHNFREFFLLSPKCKFPDCTHRNEPACAVKDAIEQGEISELRYINYMKIMEEIEDQNHWERHRHL